MSILPTLLLLLGYGFLVANLFLLTDFVRYLRRRRSALLVWRGKRQPGHGLMLGIGAALGLLLVFKLFVQRRQLGEVFGESMMFLYYGYLAPLSWRIGRGFYADGVWSENGFMPYWQIGGVAWREAQGEVTLVLISRLRNLARRLVVPPAHYGAARRLLRDKIAAHDIDFAGTGLDLGIHDDRDNV